MSPYRVRTERLADDALVIVRGGDLEIDLMRSDAVAAHARFGEYGISVFGAADEAALDALARDRLAQFEILVLMTAGAIRRAGPRAATDLPASALHDHPRRGWTGTSIDS